MYHIDPFQGGGNQPHQTIKRKENDNKRTKAHGFSSNISKKRKKRGKKCKKHKRGKKKVNLVYVKYQYSSPPSVILVTPCITDNV